MKFDLVFKKGLCTVARIPGMRDVQPHDLTMADQERIITELPHLIEKLTGYRLHIEQDAHVDK